MRFLIRYEHKALRLQKEKFKFRLIFEKDYSDYYKQENVFDKFLAVSSWCFTWSNTQDQMPRKFQKHMY